MGNIHTNTIVDWWRDDLLLVPTLRLSHHLQSRGGGTRRRNDLWSRSRKDHPPQHAVQNTEEPQKDGFDTCQQQQQYRHEEEKTPRENDHRHYFQHLSWSVMLSLRNVAMGCSLLLFGLGTPRQHTNTIRKCWNDVPVLQKLVIAAGLVVLVVVVVVALLLVRAALLSVNDDWWWWTTTRPTTALNIMEALRCGGAWYMLSLETYPMVTKSLTAGAIQWIGDYLAQWVEFALETSSASSSSPDNRSISKRTIQGGGLVALPRALSIHGRYHLRRGLSLLADGVFVSGPLMHLGYELFEKVWPVAANNDDTTANGMGAAFDSTTSAMLHVLADSVVLDSFFVAFTFLSTGLMEGIPYRQLFKQFQSDYWSSLAASWATSLALCPVQFCFFRYLPLNLRVLSVNCIDLVWGAVQSFMSHRHRHCQQQLSGDS